jgi:hypothetical protein
MTIQNKYNTVLMSMNLEACDFNIWQLPILIQLFWHFLPVLINKNTTTWLASQLPSHTHCCTQHYQRRQALSSINTLKQELTAQYTLEMTQDLNGHQLLCMFLDGLSVFLSSHCVCTIVHFRGLLLLCLWNETLLQSFNVRHTSWECLYFTKELTYFMF